MRSSAGALAGAPPLQRRTVPSVHPDAPVERPATALEFIPITLLAAPYLMRSIYPRLSMVAVRPYEERCASGRLASFHGIASKTVRRGTAPQPVLASYTLREIERLG